MQSSSRESVYQRFACVKYIGIPAALARKSPGILGLRDIFQYLPTVSVPGLALQALILHYINKGLKNQGCRGKQIGVVEASRYSANTRLPSLSIFLLHYVFHLRAKRYYTTGVESNIFLRAHVIGIQCRVEIIVNSSLLRFYMVIPTNIRDTISRYERGSRLLLETRALELRGK